MTLPKSPNDRAVAYHKEYQVICNSSIRLTDPQSTQIARCAWGQQNGPLLFDKILRPSPDWLPLPHTTFFSSSTKRECLESESNSLSLKYQVKWRLSSDLLMGLKTASICDFWLSGPWSVDPILFICRSWVGPTTSSRPEIPQSYSVYSIDICRLVLSQVNLFFKYSYIACCFEYGLCSLLEISCQFSWAPILRCRVQYGQSPWPLLIDSFQNHWELMLDYSTGEKMRNDETSAECWLAILD
jgi:hypothetical protein